jgi:hypothetical protein
LTVKNLYDALLKQKYFEVDRSWFTLDLALGDPPQDQALYLARWKGKIAHLGNASSEGLGGARNLPALQQSD